MNWQKTLFFHPPSPFPGNFCNCNSGGICTALQFLVQLPLLYTAWNNAYSEIGPEVMLWPLATSCVKDYKGHSLVQTSFTERPNTAWVILQLKQSAWKHNSGSPLQTADTIFWSFPSPSLVRNKQSCYMKYLTLQSCKGSRKPVRNVWLVEELVLTSHSGVGEGWWRIVRGQWTADGPFTRPSQPH